MINSKEGKEKPRINMTTEGLSRKQVIIPVSSNHADLIIGQANGHVISINSFLKRPILLSWLTSFELTTEALSSPPTR